MRHLRSIFTYVLPFGLLAVLAFGCDSGTGTTPDAEPFEVIWSFEIAYEGGHTRPAIDGGRAFVASDTLLRAVELHTGEPIWTRPHGRRLPPHSKELLQDGPYLYLNDVSWVKAFHKDDGTLGWTADLTRLDYHPGPEQVMQQNATHLFLAGWDGVFRIKKATGAVDLHVPLLLPETDSVEYVKDINILYPPSLSEDDLLYVPSSFRVEVDSIGEGPRRGFFYCIDAQTGTVRWRFTIPQRWIEEIQGYANSSAYGAAISGDLVMFTSGASVFALDRHTGTLVWEIFFENEDGFNLGKTIAADEERAYVSSIRSYVRALDVEDGSILWERFTGASITTYPVLHDGLVYQLNNGGSGLFVFEAATGRPLFEGGYPPEGDAYSLYWTQPAVSEEVIVIGGTKGVYGLRAPP